jgi:hypothetical protein
MKNISIKNLSISQPVRVRCNPKNRTTRTVGLSLPIQIADTIDEIAKVEYKSKSLVASELLVKGLKHHG